MESEQSEQQASQANAVERHQHLRAFLDASLAASPRLPRHDRLGRCTARSLRWGEDTDFWTSRPERARERGTLACQS